MDTPLLARVGIMQALNADRPTTPEPKCKVLRKNKIIRRSLLPRSLLPTGSQRVAYGHPVAKTTTKKLATAKTSFA
jgi:hypothetical protein